MMRLIVLLAAFLYASTAESTLASIVQQDGRAVSQDVFDSLEELARVVHISYCVGTTGIQKPFKCLSKCSDFEGFELITTWNTGPLLSDSCGYIAISHSPHKKRVIVAFRGTYSIANTIADLSTNHAEYTPFPADNDDDLCTEVIAPTKRLPILPQLLHKNGKRTDVTEKCNNCTVHSGFMTSWRNTRCTIIPHVEEALKEYPEYELTLVGHSLGGAVAALAGLEFQARGWKPIITTFGEPKIGNYDLNRFIDRRFNLNATNADEATYRRVTHVDDPVPLLPPQEWGYRMHAGEIFISRASLPPTREDVVHCSGDEDPECIAAGEAVTKSDAYDYVLHCADSDDIHCLRSGETYADPELLSAALGHGNPENAKGEAGQYWSIPKRYRLWQLFFAHRDYFWRLGLCLPDGYPWQWKGGDSHGETDAFPEDEL